MNLAASSYNSRGSQVILLIAAVACYGYFAVLVPWHYRHDNDFKHIYLGIQALYDESEPYSLVSLRLQAALHGLRGASLNPYVYLPFTGLSLGFLKPLSFPLASATWYVLNEIFMLLTTAFLAKAFWPRAATTAFSILLLCLAFNHPLVRTLTAGQLNCALLLMLTGSFCLLGRGRSTWAGVLIGYAAMFKLFPALLGAHLAAWRRWKEFCAMAGTCVLLLVGSVLVVGWKVHMAFIPMLRQMGYGRSTWEEYDQTYWRDPSNQGLNSLFSHLMVKTDATTPWILSSQSAANLATIASVLVLAGCWIWAQVRSRRSTGFVSCNGSMISQEGSYMATILLALLIPSLMWDHYLLIAFLPVVWLWKQSIAQGSWGVFGTVTAAWVLVSMPWRFDSPMFTHGTLLPLMSMKLFPTLVIYGLTLCFTGVWNTGNGERPGMNSETLEKIN